MKKKKKKKKKKTSGIYGCGDKLMKESHQKSELEKMDLSGCLAKTHLLS